MSIERFSYIHSPINVKGLVLAMVGSFAPVHYGHLDAMRTAKKTVNDYFGQTDAVVFAPNSDVYVSIKLDDKHGEWNFSRRVAEFQAVKNNIGVPTFVDDITGSIPPEKSISEEVIQTIKQKLGVFAYQIVLVVGSDQIRSMRPHLDNNRAVCVIRPNFEKHMYEAAQEEWLQKAISERRYIMTPQNSPNLIISSTAIRQKLIDVRGNKV